MAELPPEGSLLSQFIAGGGKSRRPAASSKPPKKLPYEPRMYFDPARKQWVPVTEFSAAVATGLGGTALGAVEDTITGLREELLGRDFLKRFGGEDQVVQAAYDYTNKALSDAKINKTLVRDLDLDTYDKFAAKYRPFMRSMQEQTNQERIAAGKPPIEGFGNYEVKYVGRVFFNPKQAAVSLSKQALARSSRQALNELGFEQDHPEISIFTKQELSKYIPVFIHRQIEEKSKHFESIMSDPKASMADRAQAHAVWLGLEGMLSQHARDANKPEEKRTGELSEIQKAVRGRILNQTTVKKVFDKAGGILKEFNKFDRDPIGYLIKSVTIRPVSFFFKKYLWGESKLFGRLGLNWGKRLPGWLLKKGWWGKGLNYLGKGASFALSRGTRGVVNWGSKQLGKLVGRLGLSLGKAAFKAISSAAVRAVLSMVGSVIVASAGWIIGILAGTVGLVILFVIIIFAVLIPFFQGLNSSASAAPLDLPLTITASPSQDVGPNSNITGQVSVNPSKKADNFFLTIELDANLDVVSAAPECNISGKSIRCPASTINLVSGQPASYSFVLRTSSSMTPKTVAVIRASATSTTALPSITSFAINGAGVACVDDNGPCGWPVAGQLLPYYFGNGVALHSDYGDALTFYSSVFNVDRRSGAAVDISGNDGQRICATFNGRVTETQHPDGAYGVVIVNDTSGYAARFWHMRHQPGVSPAVKVGDNVSKGQFLGLVGMSGKANGPHLHYTIHQGYYYDGGVLRSAGPGFSFADYVPGGHIDKEGRPVPGNSTITAALAC